MNTLGLQLFKKIPIGLAQEFHLRFKKPKMLVILWNEHLWEYDKNLASIKQHYLQQK